MITLQFEKRQPAHKADALRKTGKVPAVFYGKTTKSFPIAVPYSDFLRAWREAGESSVVTLVGSEGEELDALIYDVKQHPVTEFIEHADFYVFEKGQKIEVGTPLEFTGVSAAVKAGGVLVKVMHELAIEAAPKDLPHAITVDIAPLETFDSVILAKDIPLPANVTLVAGPEEVVASVYEPKEEAEEPAAEFDPNAVEVEKKGKEAKEGEGEAETPAGSEENK